MQGGTQFSKRRREAFRELGDRRPRGDRHHRNRPQDRHRGLAVHLLQPVDQTLRELEHRARAALDHPIERLDREPDELAVANGSDGRGPRLAREQRHLADALAAPDVGDETLLPILLVDEDPQPAGDHDIQGVTLVALPKQRVAAPQADPSHLGLHVLPALGIERREEVCRSDLFDRVHRRCAVSDVA